MGVSKAADKRRHPRVRVAKAVRARAGGRTGIATTRDLSAGGAAVVAGADFPLAEEGEVELDIESVGLFTGHVTRMLDDGFAVAFDLDGDDEDRLLAEITSIQNSIRFDDDR